MKTAEKYELERKRLETNRSQDWASYVPQFIIVGEQLEPLTVGAWFDLLALKSPMLYSDNPTVASVVDYLWRNSKKNTKNKLLREWRLYWLDYRVRKELNSENADIFVDAIYEHLNFSLDEYPEDMEASSSKKKNSMSAITGATSMVDEIANRYAMHPDEVLKMPLRRAFALQKVIRKINIPNYQILEPASLRAIKSQYLEELNNGED